jgi:polyhydroxyalkanoate synthesis regulator phasin
MPETSDLKHKLIHAYDQMMEHLHSLMGEAGKGTQNLQHLLDKAREKVSETGEITREEAEKISDYLKRDLQNAGEYMQDNNNDMADWLHMDIELIEWNLLDLFLQTADKTKLELLLLEENAKHVNEYHTGEITGPGTLVCTQCSEELHFLNTGHVPPCPKCRATLFKRKSR